MAKAKSSAVLDAINDEPESDSVAVLEPDTELVPMGLHGSLTSLNSPIASTDERLAAIRDGELQDQAQVAGYHREMVKDFLAGKPITAADLASENLSREQFEAMVKAEEGRRARVGKIATEAACRAEHDAATAGVAEFRTELKRRRDEFEDWQRATYKAVNNRWNDAHRALENIEQAKRELLQASPCFPEFQQCQQQIRDAGMTLLKSRHEVERLEVRIRDQRHRLAMGNSSMLDSPSDAERELNNLEQSLIFTRQGVVDQQSIVDGLTQRMIDLAAESMVVEPFERQMEST